MPVPRFWYLPRGEKADGVLSGDDHSPGSSAGFTASDLDRYKSVSPPAAYALRHPRSRDDARRRSGVQHVDTAIARAPAWQHATGRLHHKQECARCRTLQIILEALQIAANERRQIGSHRRRRGALIFPENG